MSRKYSEGDKVVYVGRGPDMEVEGNADIAGEEMVLCRWWVEKSREFKILKP